MGEGDGYTLRAAGERLGLSSRQVRRYVLDGRLPAVLVPGPRGSEYRVSAADLEALEASRSARVGRRKPGRIVSTPTVSTLASPEVGRLVSDQLQALERAWGRVAELERENATLRAALEASRSALEAGTVQEEATPPPAPPARPAPSRPQRLRLRLRRLLTR